MLKDTVGPFAADDTRRSLEKKLALLSFRTLEDNASGEASATERGKEKEAEGDAPAAEVRVDPVEEDDEDEIEDDGYLSDDPEERLDPVRAGEIAALAGYTLTLLIPVEFEKEVPRTMDTMKELLIVWKKALSPHAQKTTKMQTLLSAYLSKKRFGRMQVTFREAADANYVWCRRVEHICADGKTKLILNWQHPENPLYIKERAQNKEAVEVLLKEVPAEISPDMIYKLLVTTPLEKRGRPPYQVGAAFHREACVKAKGSSFSQAMSHVRSVQHCTAILKGGDATRASRGKVNLTAIRKEFAL
ncbi:unnamed protein product [Closterium sp. Naga37s-1]|nr:unnamed protein product [Closterium sp. Naga37s-1]